MLIIDFRSALNVFKYIFESDTLIASTQTGNLSGLNMQKICEEIDTQTVKIVDIESNTNIG